MGRLIIPNTTASPPDKEGGTNLLEILIHVDGGKYLIHTTLADDGRGMYTSISFRCPPKCNHYNETCEDVECPHRDSTRETTILDRYTPKIIAVVEKIIPILELTKL